MQLAILDTQQTQSSLIASNARANAIKSATPICPASRDLFTAEAPSSCPGVANESPRAVLAELLLPGTLPCVAARTFGPSADTGEA